MKTNLRRISFLFFLAAVSFLLSYVAGWSGLFGNERQRIASEFQDALLRKEARAGQLLRETQSLLDSVPAEALFAKEGLSEKVKAQGFSLFIYENDSLRYWSDNRVPVDQVLDPASFHSRVLELANGWYDVLEVRKGKFKVFLTILLKHRYPYKNKFLQSDPAKGFPSFEGLNISKEEEERAIPIHPGRSEIPFYLVLPDEPGRGLLELLLAGFFAFTGIISFLFFLDGLFLGLKDRIGTGWLILLIPSVLILVRYLSMQIAFPPAWEDHELFDPALYASMDWFPNLGDFLINSLLLLFFAWFLNKRGKEWVVSGKVQGLSFVLLVLTLANALLIGVLFPSLIRDSSIPFELNQLYNLSWYSFIGLTGITFLLFTFSLFADAWAYVIRREQMSRVIWAGVLLIVGGYIYLAHQVGILDLVLILWPLPLMAIFYSLTLERKYPYGAIVGLLAIYAFLGAHILSRFTEKKEHHDREVLAENLAVDEDPVTDLLFREIEQDLLNDDGLSKVFQNPEAYSREALKQMIEQNYFSGYWDKYRIIPHMFAQDSTPVMPVQEEEHERSFAQFEAILKGRSENMQLSDHLYFVRDPKEKTNYLAKLEICGQGFEDTQGYLFLEMSSKQVPREIGFPKLLLDEGAGREEVLLEYAYARYVHGELIDRTGEFPFPIRVEPFLKDREKDTYFFTDQGFEHLVYEGEGGLVILLSRPTETWLDTATLFSYLFLLFSIFLLLASLGKTLLLGIGLHPLSLKSKVQLIMVGIVVVAMILFGTVTQYFIREQYIQKNEDQISEKTHSVLIELRDRFGMEERLSEDLSGYLAFMLSKFSNVFFTDINLFDPAGNLIATSRPKIYDKGLLSEKMHSDAYRVMVLEKKSEFIQEENIGQLRYLSAYVPFLNEEGKVLGYLGLPYFAKQSELEKELSAYFVAVINILVLLFALSILAALFLSNWVTRPLRLLQEGLAGIELGGSGKRLEYQGNDEIADLVEEYNNKVVELQEKAEMLARSERESAWREMAKQVAHEIKNPLTPMKLRLQHLQKEGETQDPDPEKIRKLSDHLIEQIDTLANIAGEFSNLAKMPRAREEQFDLYEVLTRTVDLYKDVPEIEMVLNNNTEEDSLVIADKEQIGRVFNNLLSNAIQAIPEGKEGKVVINLERQVDMVLVKVRDNGKGIAEEDQERIFEPDFTTKTGGTGLGLAIARNIVEMSGGLIWMQSQENVGSTFYVQLPSVGG